MKKNSILFLALTFGIVAASLFACGTVFAEAPMTESQKIQQFINKIDGIKDSRVFAYDDCAIIAVRTNGVYLKSAEEELQKNLTSQIKEAFSSYKNIKVTTSLKIFKAIEQLNRLIETGEVDPDDFLPKKPRPSPMPDIKVPEQKPKIQKT